jgi:hypothetical protein
MRSVSMAITAGLVMGGDPDFSARPDQFMNPSQTAHFRELLMQMRADAVHGMASSPSLDGTIAKVIRPIRPAPANAANLP